MHDRTLSLNKNPLNSVAYILMTRGMQQVYFLREDKSASGASWGMSLHSRIAIRPSSSRTSCFIMELDMPSWVKKFQRWRRFAPDPRFQLQAVMHKQFGV
jgi:hypothetical protein